MALWGQGLAQSGLSKNHQKGGCADPEGGKGAGGPGGGLVGGTEGGIPVGAGSRSTVESVALSGSPDGTEGLEPGQPGGG